MKKRIVELILVFILIIISFNNKLYAVEEKSISEVEEGDYIEYTAGEWTKKEIKELKKENLLGISHKNPENNEIFKFYEIKEGQSRDKCISGKEYPTGWRILYNQDGQIYIVTSGITEMYTSSFGDNFAYVSEYIFTGNKHFDNIQGLEEYNVRDWSMYENLDYAVPKTAHMITIKEAYYITKNDGDTKNNLRNIGVHYYSSTIHCDKDLWTVEEDGKLDRWGGNFGVRVVVKLRDDLKVEKIGNKNGKNIWRLIKNENKKVYAENNTDDYLGNWISVDQFVYPSNNIIVPKPNNPYSSKNIFIVCGMAFIFSLFMSSIKKKIRDRNQN